MARRVQCDECGKWTQSKTGLCRECRKERDTNCGHDDQDECYISNTEDMVRHALREMTES